MNKTVIKLAFDQIRWNKKKTILEILIICLISATVFIVNITYPHLKEIYRSWCDSRYGPWYAYIEIPDDTYDLFRWMLDGDDARDGRKPLFFDDTMYDSLKDEDYMQYGYLFEQGEWNGYTIAHVDPSVFDLCRLSITEGTIPEDNAILISEQLRDEYSLTAGTRLNLEINGNTEEYVVSGFLRKSQDFFPDIYTAVSGGHAFYFFDRMFAFHSPSSKTILFSQFGLTVHYVENRFGYDHFTRVNDLNRWMKEDTAFDDYTLAQLMSAFTAILFLLLVQLTGSKKRARQLTLLRAIGMTSEQVVSMVMLETTVISVMGIICGFALSLLSAGAVGLMMTSIWKIQTDPLWHDFIRSPLQSIGIFVLVLSFCLLGAYVPALKASQNALNGSFEEIYLGKKKKHRKKLCFQSMRVLGLRQLENQKGIWIVMSVFAAFLCMIGLPEKENDALETSGSSRGIETVAFTSMHFIQMAEKEPVDPEIYAQLPVRAKQYRAGSGISEGQLIPGNRNDQTYSLSFIGDFLILDPDTVTELVYDGRLPENSREVMIIPPQLNIHEIREDSYWQVDYEARIGDTIILNEEAYTVCGMVLPSETVPSVIDYAIDFHDLYSVPPCPVFVLPETAEHLGLQECIFERLYFDRTEQMYPLLSAMVKNGFRPDMISTSDRYIVFDSYDNRSVSVHLSYGAAAIPFVMGILFFTLFKALENQSEKRELIIMKCMGMSGKQLLLRQFWMAVYTSGAALSLVLGYDLLRLISHIPWHVSPLVFVIEFLITTLVFTLIYAVVLLNAGGLRFDGIMED
ncbi:MAG: ABC transporter permease [Solobacterium sp.]|nr:ABC transporter permease [Solobacterium sp.]